jgi:hypothetical protein
VLRYYNTTRRHNPEDLNLNLYLRKSLKPCTSYLIQFQPFLILLGHFRRHVLRNPETLLTNYCTFKIMLMSRACFQVFCPRNPTYIYKITTPTTPATLRPRTSSSWRALGPGSSQYGEYRMPKNYASFKYVGSQSPCAVTGE